jgi:uncharacterized membrane protein YqjE
VLDQHVDKLVKQNQLEGKLAETKFAKAQVEMMHEKELLLRVMFMIIYYLPFKIFHLIF